MQSGNDGIDWAEHIGITTISGGGIMQVIERMNVCWIGDDGGVWRIPVNAEAIIEVDA